MVNSVRDECTEWSYGGSPSFSKFFVDSLHFIQMSVLFDYLGNVPDFFVRGVGELGLRDVVELLQGVTPWRGSGPRTASGDIWILRGERTTDEFSASAMLSSCTKSAQSPASVSAQACHGIGNVREKIKQTRLNKLGSNGVAGRTIVRHAARTVVSPLAETHRVVGSAP